MRKVKLSHKILSSVLALLMVFTSFPIINTYAAVDENLGQVSAITKPAEINDTDQSKIVVTYNEITLEWSPADKTIGRTKDGWWAGIKMAAPNLDASVLENATYESFAYGTNEPVKNKSFWKNQDSKETDEQHYITLWTFVNEENLNKASSTAEGVISTSWSFDWNNDGTNEQTVTTQISPKSVILNKDGKQVYPVQPGTVTAITNEKNAVIDDKDSANIVVSYKDKLELEWSPTDKTVGRTKDGWWTGIKMTAPELDASVLKNATYDSLANGTTDWLENKSFWNNQDSKATDEQHYITLWTFVNEEDLNDALTLNSSIETSWRFDWNNDSIMDQIVTTQINPSEVEVILNKDNKQVYPATELGTVTGITGTPNIENDKTNSVSVSYNKEVTLQWSQASNETNLPRPKDGWWAGIKMTAPQGADLENAKYKSKATPESKWIEGKEFAKAKDGDDFITLWAHVANEDMLKNGINTQWGFDWDNDGVYEQYVDFKFDSTYVTLDPTNFYAMDKNPPVFGDDINNTDEQNVVWVNDPVTISGSVEDYNEHYRSEIKEVYYAQGEHTGKTKPENAVNLDLSDGKFSFEVTDDYQGWYTIVCVDNAGNIVTQKVYVKIDNTAPEFENVTPDITEWKKGSITIEGTVIDTLSKVKSVEYSQGKNGDKNPANLNIETGAFSFEIPSTITYSGEYYIYCTDNAGKESVATVLVNIDNEKCIVVLNPNSMDWTNKPVTITGSIQDNHSGIGSIFYRKSLADDLNNLENLAESKDDIEVKPNADGSFVINLQPDDYAGNYIVYGKDKVGNISNGVTFEVQMDKTAPKVNSVETPTDWTNQNVTVKGTVSDNLSQVKAVFYKLVDDENWNDAVLDENGKNYSFEIEKQNYNDVVQVYCVDNADNKSEIATSTLFMDTEEPNPVEITYSTSVIEKILKAVTFGFYQTACEVTLTSTDNLSGIKSFDYSIDGGKTFATINKESKEFKISDKSATATFTISPEFIGNVTATATDDSGTGNTSVSVTDEKTVVVDNTSPEISVKYISEDGKANFVNAENKSVSSLAEAEKVYYNKAVSAEITIDEENFYEGQAESVKDENGNIIETKTVHEVGILVEKTVDNKTTYIEYLPKTAEGAQSAEKKYSEAESVEYFEWDSNETLHIAKIDFSDDADYKLIVEYTDYSENYSNVTDDNGNKSENLKTYESKIITVDTTAPIVTVSYDNNKVSENALNDTYFNANRTATITVVEHNFAPEYIASKITAVDVNGKDVTTKAAEVLAGITTKDNWTQDEEDKNTYTYVIEYSDDASYTFEFTSAKDYALNEMNPANENKVIYAENTVSPENFVIDKVAPSDVEITYSESVLDEVLRDLTFGFYQGNCKVTLKTTDETSGVQYFDYSYDVNDVVNTGNEGKVVEIAKVTSRDGSTYICEFEISAQFRGQVTAKATDNAGNTPNEAVTDKKNIVVDNIAPGISVSYSAPANSNGDIDYYSNDVTVTVTVEEENFMDGEYKSEVSDMKISAVIEDDQEKTSTETYKITDWERVENTDKWTGTFVLKTEGDYTLTIDYTDKSDNKADTYTRGNLTIDKTSPVVTINYNNNEVSGNALNAKYFDKNRTATITVVEHNFAPEYLENNISIIANDILTDQDADMGIRTAVAKQLEEIVAYGNWNHDGNTHTFDLKYTDDAIYDFALSSFKDYALNEMNPNADSEVDHKVIYAEDTESPEHFVVDTTKPTNVEITYSNNLYKNENVLEDILDNLFWFYNPDKGEKCTVTLATTDMTSGIQYFTYSYDNNTDFIDVQTKNIENKNVPEQDGIQDEKNLSVFTYSFDIPAQFRGKVKATATDNAGNVTENETISDKTIVVDTDIPGLEVAYSETANPANTEKNKTDINYYSDDVTVTFSVDEENFMDGEFKGDVNDFIANVIIRDEKNNYIYGNDEQGKPIPKRYPITDWTRDEKTNKWIGSITLEEEGDYTLDINYADKSKNAISYTNVDYQFTIDKTAPIVEIAYDDYANKETRVGKGYFINRTATITVVEHNFTPEYIEAVLSAKSITSDISTLASQEVAGIKTTGWTHNGNIHTFTIHYSDDAIYDFSLNELPDMALNEMKNKEGNETVFNKDAETPDKFTVDKTSPADVVITYSDDLYKEDSTVLETILDNLFWFYNPKNDAPCQVTLTTTDMTSGLQYFTYSYDGNDTVVTENTNGGEKQAKSWKQDEEDLSKFTYTFTIDPQFRGKVTASATDNAGNVTKNPSISDKTIIVDSIIPDITATYPAPTNVHNNISYYDNNITVTLNVKEENFMDGEFADYVRDILISTDIVDENNNKITKSYKVNNWERVNNTDEWTGSFVLSTEGDYTLNISYSDKSGNTGTYSKSNFTIDKTAPTVDVKFDSIKSIHKIDGREYYNTNRSAVITVTEHNFFPEYFETENILKAQNILGDEVTNYIKYFKDSKNWTTDSTGNVHTIKVDFKSDANYTFDFEFKDLAKNKCADYKEYWFTVDKTAPKNLKVSYSANVYETVINAITFGYYDSKMTVTISADDDTTGIYHFMYSYLTANGVSNVNAQLVNDAINRAKITRNGKTSTATFTIPKSSLERNSQFNGTVEFTAYDYAENNTYRDDTKRVIVDNISPTSTITFNEPVQNANNVSYYAGNIDATISINEANFYSQDVEVIVTKDGSRYPVSVNWTDNSVDSHTGTFRLTEDGDYVVRVVYSDRSGNAMATYESNQLIIDTVDPVITVTGLNHQSANNGETIGFSISVTDKNIALSEFKPVLTAVIRNDNGEFETITIGLGDPVTSTNDRGETVYTYTVQNLSVDGFYSLTCSAVDYANHSVNLINSGQDNGTSSNEETMNFSVNREGSTFWIETTHNDKYSSKTFTNELDKAYANDSVEIVVHELNVDQVNISNDSDEETVFALHDGSSTGYVTLQEGSGSNGNYVKNTLRGEGGWYETRYTLSNDNFAHDGVYSFSILSYDRAGNSNLNTKDDTGVIKFTVDRTNPVITSNISTDQVIDADSHTVEFEINDTNHDKNTVEVTLNGKPVPNESITSLGGNSYSFEMSAGSKQSVSVTSKDLAGNTADQYEINDVTISTNRFVLFYYSHTLLFWIIVAGIVLLALLILFIVFRKKKDEDEDEEKA